MPDIRPTSSFKKAFKVARYGQRPPYSKWKDDWEEILDCLKANKTLDPKYKPHSLSGYGVDMRSCHIKPNLVLRYEKTSDKIYLHDITRHGNRY